MAGPRTLNTFRRLLSYPGDNLLEAAELLYIILNTELPAAAVAIGQFGSFVEQHTAEQIEEAYVSAFEINASCALEIGWQLFGEDYDRGMLLVRLREELRRFGISETTELPDHLSHVLPLISVMPEPEAKRFVQACVIPAVQKMREAIEKTDSPYRFVLIALSVMLQSVWGDGRPLMDGSVRGAGTRVVREDGTAVPEGVDLLHAFPAADVNFGCEGGCQGGCGSQADQPQLASLVQLGGISGHREEAY